VTAISGGSFATSHDLAWAEDVLSSVGTVVRLPERLLDAVTGVSGSGPAWFFLVAESLVEAGVQMGLTRELSRTLVVETMFGSAALLRETGREPEELRAMVTSPAGTTAAGIRILEARAVRSAFMEAVAAATERSRNLQR
jgi:pyrroline-5-carboxylate reductase